jgi:hypothetical protein
MPPPRRNSPEEDGKNPWVRAQPSVRVRPWAYEELLLGTGFERERAREVDAVVVELRRAHDELAVLYRALDQHIAEIESLERRLQELAPAAEEPEPPRPGRPKTFPHRGVGSDTDGGHERFRTRQIDSLSRCEGFRVDSPGGPVGFVEGLRFVSRIDRPDLLEVRGGRFGRQLLVIPVDEVEEVRVGDELVLLRSSPEANEDLLAELVERVRGALHLDHVTPDEQSRRSPGRLGATPPDRMMHGGRRR